MSQKEIDLHTQMLRWAEDDYERGLSRLCDLGCEPNIHRLPSAIAPLLFCIQAAVEASEGFVLDTDRLKYIKAKLNEIREEAALEPVEHTSDHD